MSATQEARLRDGAATLGVALTDVQVAQLLSYMDLLAKWGRVYNLTAVRDPAEMLTHHLLDSLALIPALRRYIAQTPVTSMLDVGSGAGLPGVVVAVCQPEIQVSCVDTVAKKVGFIRQAAVQLKLTNLQGIHARVENLVEQYDVVTSRAFASLLDFTAWSTQARAPQGVWLAMKGKYPTEEIAALPSSVQVFHVEQLAVPDLVGERCLVWLR